MASPLNTKQKARLLAELDSQIDNFNIVLDWAPDLFVNIDGTEILFDAGNRNVKVGDHIVDGNDFRGKGFTERMVATALEILRAASAPEVEEPEPAAEPTALPKPPATPKSPTKAAKPTAQTNKGIKIEVRKPLRIKTHPRVQQGNTWFTSRS